MPDNALERLYAESLTKDEQQYSTEDLLDSEEGENFFEKMSNESKDYLMSKIQKVELEEVQLEEPEPTVEDIFDEDEEEEEIVEEPKRGRGRPRKIQTTDDEVSTSTQNVPITSLNMFMDSLAKDLINELRTSNYKTRNFSREQMLVILNYLEEKI